MTPFQLATVLGVKRGKKKPKAAGSGIDEDELRLRFLALEQRQSARVH